MALLPYPWRNLYSLAIGGSQNRLPVVSRTEPFAARFTES